MDQTWVSYIDMQILLPLSHQENPEKIYLFFKKNMLMQPFALEVLLYTLFMYYFISSVLILDIYF